MGTAHKIMLAAALLGLVNFGLLIVFGDRGLADLQRQRAVHRRMEAANRALEASNRVLFRRVQRLKADPAYLETVARRQLLLVRPEEIVVTLPPATSGKEP